MSKNMVKDSTSKYITNGLGLWLKQVGTKVEWAEFEDTEDFEFPTRKVSGSMTKAQSLGSKFVSSHERRVALLLIEGFKAAQKRRFQSSVEPMFARFNPTKPLRVEALKFSELIAMELTNDTDDLFDNKGTLETMESRLDNLTRLCTASMQMIFGEDLSGKDFKYKVERMLQLYNLTDEGSGLVQISPAEAVFIQEANTLLTYGSSRSLLEMIRFAQL